MNLARDLITAVLLLSGTSLTLVAAIGLHRLPDTFSRFHAATKPATLGIGCLLIGAAVQLDDLSDVSKLVLALLLQLGTAPVASHLLGRATRAGMETPPDPRH